MGADWRGEGRRADWLEFGTRVCYIHVGPVSASGYEDLLAPGTARWCSIRHREVNQLTIMLKQVVLAPQNPLRESCRTQSAGEWQKRALPCCLEGLVCQCKFLARRYKSLVPSAPSFGGVVLAAEGAVPVSVV